MINKERLENLTQEVWKGAIKLRGKFKAKDYPSVIFHGREVTVDFQLVRLYTIKPKNILKIRKSIIRK